MTVLAKVIEHHDATNDSDIDSNEDTQSERIHSESACYGVVPNLSDYRLIYRPSIIPSHYHQLLQPLPELPMTCSNMAFIHVALPYLNAREVGLLIEVAGFVRMECKSFRPGRARDRVMGINLSAGALKRSLSMCMYVSAFLGNMVVALNACVIGSTTGIIYISEGDGGELVFGI